MNSCAKALEAPLSWRCEHRHSAIEHPACWKRFKERLEANQRTLDVDYVYLEKMTSGASK